MSAGNGHSPRHLDPQELKIAKALIRNPRTSDNRLGEENEIPIRTVSRKRARMERDGLLRYFAEVDMSVHGTGHFQCRHLYIIKFRIGVTERQIRDEVRTEPNVVTVFTRTIYASHIAEIDGQVALVMIVEGASESDIVDRVHGEIVPSLRKNHGDDAIEDVSTIRLLRPIRMLRNYLPDVNMHNGVIRTDWSNDAIYVA
jgi:DNA-binding Lrp family transcriptional regulator